MHVVADGAPADDNVVSTATAFLSSWQASDTYRAAQLTTNPRQARIELGAFRRHTGVTSVTLSPGHTVGATMPFKVVAHIDHGGTSATWTYHSRLAVVRDSPTGRDRVSWHSNVIHPSLPDGGGYTLRPFTEAVAPTVTDNQGAPLKATDHPGLRQILHQLQDRYPDREHQILGIRLSSDGDSGAGRIVATLKSGRAAGIRTGVDAAVQKAVDAAVAGQPGASVVVVRPSTGDVLAAATPAGTDLSPAVEGVQAPGQAFELVTTAALLEHKAVTSHGRVDCPASATVTGRTFTTPGGWHAQGTPFTDVFAHACDTAYVQLADALTGDELAAEARDVFGLGLDWHTGVTTADGAVPVLKGADKAAAAIGRGEVRLNTLDLASVTATVQNGSFRQPMFVDPKTSGQTRAHTRRVLPGRVADELRALMRGYAQEADTDGAAFGGVADQFQDSPEPIVGWFTASRGDLALAVTAPEKTHRPDNAGDVARAVLDAASG
ncbi:penicillin-binding protein [Streptomyces seoulensis]|uniref:Penicillin-binding protein n=2 Tax=Streptomyces seoulensis TaxID=73044 RepID=A0A4P6TR86_STRSO|nr:penicillin-binding transpeptidase domain-containing protein [Streptomyces seoulensis]QBJ89083.1 penicillin-binding protein [Streptomyces seoulensis]